MTTTSTPTPMFPSEARSSAAPTAAHRSPTLPSPRQHATDTAAHVGDVFGYVDLLEDPERNLLARLRDYLESEVAPGADEVWARDEFPRHVIAGLGGLDLAGLGYTGPDGSPLSAHHGRGVRASRLVTGFVSLELGRVDASVNTFFGVHAGLAMGSIATCGSLEQQARWLPAMARMDVIGAFALTEPDRGSDIAGGLATSARRDGDEWVLDGQKRWIGNATIADLTVVWARDTDDGQVKAFVVEAGTPGFTATVMSGKTALRAIENAEIVLDGVRVAEANRLPGARSFRDTGEVLRQTRGGVAWGAVGLMMAAYEHARDYAIRREQFGRPLAGFQLVADRLATMLGNVTSSLAMVVGLAQLQDRGVNRDEHAALVKATVTARMRETVALARETFGGNGILLDHPVARLFADAEALYTYEGTHDINQLIVARAATGTSALT